MEWKEKAENLELELQQYYKAHTRLSDQLVTEIAECREAKALVQEKEELITNLQSEMSQTRLLECFSILYFEVNAILC